MICPYCEHDNVPGEACCEGCSQDLTTVEGAGGRSPVESSILAAPLSKLEPKPPVVVPPDATVAETIEELVRQRIGCALVGTPSQIIGVFSERDALLRVAERYDEIATRPVCEFMTTEPETLEASTPIAYALNRMSVGDFRHLPVEQGGRIVGVISLRDVLDYVCGWYPDLIAVG